MSDKERHELYYRAYDKLANTLYNNEFETDWSSPSGLRSGKAKAAHAYRRFYLEIDKAATAALLPQQRLKPAETDDAKSNSQRGEK